MQINWNGMVNWNQLYATEQDLLNDMMKVDVQEFIRRRFNGFQYLESFQKQYASKGQLSDKQMTMLKRMAKEIFKYHNWK